MKSFINSLLIGFLTASSSAADKPNILFIFCDDLGYGDIGVFHQNARAEAGKPAFSTPHLDQLADDGIQLRAHYAPAPVCAPSRASLFLGRHQGNSPIRNNQFDKALPNQPNLASTLRQAGYRTALIGKYGLQGQGNSAQTWAAYPTKRGFDYFLGGVRHKDGHEHYPFDKIHHKHQRTEIWEQNQEISKDLKGCYTTDLFTAASKRFLINHSQNHADQPFFLFLSYDTPHAATQLATSPYPEGFGVKGGIQWLGRPGKMINTAHAQPDNYIHPDYVDRKWPMTPKRYASSVRRIDNSVADIRQTLVDLGMAQNTLVIFTSDHGPSQESYLKERLSPTFFQSYGPFTGIKRDCWEGGIRPGALVAWPDKIKPKSITESPSQMHDWLATLCDAAGAPTPAIADGVSLVPTLTNQKNPPISTIYVEYYHARTTPKFSDFPQAQQGAKRNEMQVIRQGNLKAIRHDIQSAKDPFLVFDLSQDPAEKNNLAGQAHIPSQSHWLAATARLHGQESSAKRPYDNLPIPALTVEQPIPGVLRRSRKGKTPYASRISDAVPADVVTTMFTEDLTGNTQFSGYIQVEADGHYHFSFTQGAKAVLRIHGILTLDSDSAQPAHTWRKLYLKSGLHPFTLNVRTSGTRIGSPLLWEKADTQKLTPIPATALFHAKR